MADIQTPAVPVEEPASVGGDKQQGEGGDVMRAGTLSRAGTMLSRAGTTIQRAATVSIQRANSLPQDDKDLRHAATMPMVMDVESDRPFCCGLWKTQQLIGVILGVGLAIFFLSARVVPWYPKADAMIAVLCATGCFWIFEVMPIYITALMPMVLMPLFEITSTDIAASAYWNWVSMLFLGAFIVDVAMEHVHLPRRLLLLALTWTGAASPGVVLAVFMSVSFFLSMVCSDIAITLMLAPFATGLMNTIEDEALSHASEANMESQESQSGASSSAQGGHQGSTLAGLRRFGAGLMLGIAYAATAGGIATTIGTPVNAILVGVDILAGEVSFGSWLIFALPISLCMLVLGFCAIYFAFARGVDMSLSSDAIASERENFEKEVGEVTSDEVLVGLIQLLLFVTLCFQPLIDKQVANQLGTPLSGSATTTCLCALLVFLLPSRVRPGESLLTWRVAQEKVPWGALLLIGGGFALAKGFRESGLDIALGEALGKVVHEIPELALHFIIVFGSVICIQIMNSIAAAACLLPMFEAASLSSVTNPLWLLLPATIGCSLSFVLPTASPANAVALAKSRDLVQPLRVRDFARAGLPLTLVGSAIAALLSYEMSELVFDAGAPFPQWACDSGVNCIWAEIPGEVNGRVVTQQACIPIDADEGMTCITRSGDIYNVADVAPAYMGFGPLAEPEDDMAGAEESEAVANGAEEGGQ